MLFGRTTAATIRASVLRLGGLQRLTAGFRLSRADR